MDGNKGKRHRQRKRILNLGTWNIQGISTKQNEVFTQLEKYNIDMGTLTEVKKKGTGNQKCGSYIFFYSGVPKEKRAKAGVAIVIHKKYQKNIKNWEEISERIMKMELNVWGQTLVVIAAYAPTDDSAKIVKDEFENSLMTTLSTIGRNKEIILLGDLNARTGHRKGHPVVGNFGEEVTNDNGMRLIELCSTLDLQIMNGYFAHKDIHKYTWIQPTRKLKSIIDYYIQKQKSSIKTLDVRAYRGAECGTDHILIRAQIRLQFKHHKKQTTTENEHQKIGNVKYNIELLKDESIQFLYKLRLADKLQNVGIDNVEEGYSRIKEKIHGAAFEALGKAGKKLNDDKPLFWTMEIKELIEEKKSAYHKWLTTKDQEDRKHYARISRAVKKEVIKAKNNMWNDKCKEIERYIGGTKSREAWKTVRNLRKNNRETTNINMIKMEEWKTYYEKMLNEDRDKYKQNENRYIIGRDRKGTIVSSITKLEIYEALKKCKNGKSPGPGDIPIELIKRGPDILIELLQNLFNQCLIREEKIPMEWRTGLISSIHKKGSRQQCDNYRGITVTASIGRLYGRIVKNRIEQEIQIGEEQAGFTAGKSCVDNIFTLRQLTSKRVARNLETHLVFVDLEKAYDTVPHKKLFEVLEKSQISYKYLQTIRDIYDLQMSAVKMGNRMTDPFKVTKGLRQGCVLSPSLFKIYIQEVLKEWQAKCRTMGIEIQDQFLCTLLFADDQVVIAADEDDINYMLRKLTETFERWGLKINFDKTKYLVAGGSARPLNINNKVIDSCSDYKYLGSIISEEANSRRDIDNRIIQGRKAVQGLNSVWWSKQITTNTKVNIYNSVVKSITTYGAESWEITERNKERLMAVEMDALRRSCRLSRLQHVRNDDIRRRTNIKRTIVEDIEKKRLLWYGHLRRMETNRWPQKTWDWTPTERRRKRGRPVKDWNDGVEEARERRGLGEDEWQNKKQWRIGCEKRPEQL